MLDRAYYSDTFPRMGGGDPEAGVGKVVDEIFSPHGRG